VLRSGMSDTAVTIAQFVAGLEHDHGPAAAARFVASMIDDVRRAIDADLPADAVGEVFHRLLVHVVSLDRDAIGWDEFDDAKLAVARLRRCRQGWPDSLRVGLPGLASDVDDALDGLAVRLDRIVADRQAVTDMETTLGE
jgi:hypothetical protein